MSCQAHWLSFKNQSFGSILYLFFFKNNWHDVGLNPWSWDRESEVLTTQLSRFLQREGSKLKNLKLRQWAWRDLTLHMGDTHGWKIEVIKLRRLSYFLSVCLVTALLTVGLFTFIVWFAKVHPIFKFRTDFKNLDHSALKLF